MPFGPYEDFADCVAQNGDKGNPEAFCAFLHHKITGKWPAEASKHSPEALSTLDTQVNLAISNALKTFHFQAPETRSVHGVEVFAVGSWRDSVGRPREWTLADLKAMVKAFSPGSVPLKAGHTSPEFNCRVAAALGVPVELLQGDQAGKGQMALGHMTKLALRGDKLVAGFEGVPAPLAEMIEGGQYTSVSSEIEIDNQGQLKLTAVALLGVESPAIESLAGLEAAAVFGKRENALVFSFSHKQEGDKMEKLKADSTLGEVAALFQEGAGDALTAIAVALGLDPASASLASVLKAITDLKAGGAGMMPEAVVEQKAAFAKAQGDIGVLQETVKAQATTIATFEHERRVGKYTRLAEGWGAIPGKPEEIGAQLAETEEKAGEKVAQMVLAQFQAANEAAESAGVLGREGTARTGVGESEADKFLKTAEASGLNHAKAIVKLSKERPDLFRQFQAVNMIGGNGNGE